MVLSVGVALVGIYLARTWYLKKTELPERLSVRFATMYKLVLNKYYVDEVYEASVITPVVKGSEKLLWRGIDVGVIDWFVNGLASTVGFISRTVRVVQTGVTQSYALVFLVGVIAIVGWLIVK
jgi:NADH-quinone oxidoreductase subunit L